MADSDASLDVLIRILTEEVGQERADKVMEKYTEQAKEGGKEQEKLNLHGKEMHRVMHQLNALIPGLGSAIKLAFNFSPMLAVALAVGAVVSAVEHYRKKLEDAAKAQAALEAAVWEAQRAGAEAAAAEAAKFAEAIKSAVSDQDKLKQKYDQQLAVLKALIAEHQQMIDILEKEALAAAKGDAAQEAAIKKRFDDLRAMNDVTEETMQLELKQAELREQMANKAKAAAAAEKAQKDYAAFKNNPLAQSDAAAAATWNKENPLDTLEFEARKKGTLGEHRRNIEAMTKTFGEGSPEVEGSKALAGDAAQAWSKIEKFKANQALLDSQKRIEEELAKAAEQATGKLVDLTKKISDLQAATSTAGKELEVHKRQAFAKQEGGAVAMDLAAAEAVAEKMAQGGKPNADETQLLIAVASRIAGHTVDAKTAQSMMLAAEKNVKIQIDFMQRTLDSLSKLHDYSLIEFQRMAKGMDDLEKKIGWMNHH